VTWKSDPSGRVTREGGINSAFSRGRLPELTLCASLRVELILPLAYPVVCDRSCRASSSRSHAERSRGMMGSSLHTVQLGRGPMRFPRRAFVLSNREVVGFGTTISSARCAVSNCRDLFQAALLNTNPSDLEQRVTTAQQAIDERMRELIQENIQASKEEREIRDAV